VRPRPTHRPVTGYLGSRRTLLVVDDQPTQRQMLIGMLAPLGFQTREAASGSECLESVGEHPPDAVLLDISMDDMDGWETARRIRAAGLTELPIIIVSANAFENTPDKLADANCQGFVDKPVIESELLEVLERSLQIEWLAELALPSWANAAGGPIALPVEVIGELIRLTRLGHMQGIRDALDAALLRHPECLVEGKRLRELLDRFDLEGFLEQLAGSLRAAPAETA
jgi:CheY-like chemotaxis protein